ncbi:MAG TPA: protoporphyrinogen oxidase [Candidatus Acidoferrales bacterium]|jgi:oxygen-dependent protoporphyrinogen oxidase|nr:protoporphyrinogen oxidase [Candidatus Acidoferrales bacterium]
MPRVVIIGGGISGLSAAYYLAKGGSAATILESRGRLGGVIQTERADGCTIEAGPDSFLSTKPAALELIRELGLADQVIGSNDHLRITYIRKGGRLVPMPDGLMMMVPTRIMPLLTTGLLSFRTKVRMGMELLRSPKMKAGDESVAQFVEEHYGAEAVDYLAEPLLSGIYGGSPSELSVTSVLPRFVSLAAKYGSLTRGVLAERAKARNGAPPAAVPLFRTLKGGLQQMVDAVAAAIRPGGGLPGAAEVRTGRAEAVERAGAGFRIKLGSDWIPADRLVVACEAHNAAALLSAVDPRLAELLGTVPYSSSMTVALGFDAADFARLPDGFGFLVPKKERRRLVACTWVGTKFSNRVPDGKVVARCFLGGMGDAAVLAESDDAVVAQVSAELQEIAGITALPKFSRIFRWPRSMAQYTVGHPQRLAEMEARVAQIPGLHLAGNAYTGIGIPDCIRMGKAAAENILAAH